MAKATKRTTVLDRAAFFRDTKLPRETVHIAELGGDVIVQGLTGKQRDAFEASCIQTKGSRRTLNLVDSRAKLVMLSVINPDGSRMFQSSDVAQLSAMPAFIVDRLFSVAQRLSGITEQEIEDLGKLLGEGPDEPSPSDLLSGSEDEP